MMKNETKTTKCRECRCTVLSSAGEQLNELGFCSWMCMQDYEVGANYMEYRGIHR